MTNPTRLPGPLAPCPCADKATCPECNGTLPIRERVRRRFDRMTGAESVEMLRRIQQVCEDEEFFETGDSEEVADGSRS